MSDAARLVHTLDILLLLLSFCLPFLAPAATQWSPAGFCTVCGIVLGYFLRALLCALIDQD